MAKAKHKPLFNRRYLLILVWVLPLVILLLQPGADETAVNKIQWDPQRQAYLLPAQRDDILLTLILPFSQALSDQGWVQQRTRTESLRQRLAMPELQDWLAAQGWQAELSQTTTHLRVALQMTKAPQAEQMSDFLDRLTSLAGIDQNAIERRTQAERYLQKQDEQVRLLSALGDQLADQPQRPDALSAATSIWTLTGDIDAPPGTQPPSTPAAQTDHWTPGTRTLDGSSRPATPGWELTGYPQPAPASGRELALQRLDAELVAQVLPIAMAGHESYRWIWKPLARGGYRALLAQGGPPPSAHQLSQHLDPALLDTTRTALLERYDQILEESPQQWLEMLALYRLPLDSHQAFRDTLNAVDLNSAKSRVNRLFNPEQSLYVRFTTVGSQP